MKVVLISTDETLAGIGIRILSAALRERQHETALVFLSTDADDLGAISWPELEALCRGAGLIGISCMTHGVRKAIEVGRALRKTQTAPIVIGGIHACLAPESLLEEFDFVCHGEGEDLIAEMADRLESGGPVRDIPGLWRKEGRAIIRNASQPLKRELDGYPFPDYDLTHQYVLECDHLVPMRPVPHVGQDYFVVLGSRGCPHQCAYCSNSRLKQDFPWRKKVRHHSVDYLIRHMKQLNGLFPHIRTYWIDDDTFFAKSLAEIEEFSRRYRAEIGRPFLVLTSPATFSEEKLKPLVKAGLNRLITGVQSGSDRVNREMYRRPVPGARILEIAGIVQRYSASVVPCYDFIGMNPFETGEDILSTLRFIRSLPPPFFIYNNNLAFYPGTELHRRAVAEGWNSACRVKHSDASIGLRILRDEPIRHKLFHFLLLEMAGSGNRERIGRVRRSLVTDSFLSLYRALDRCAPRFTDAFISWRAGRLLRRQESPGRGLGGYFKEKLRRWLPARCFNAARETYRFFLRIPGPRECLRRARRGIAQWRLRRMLRRVPRFTRDRCWCGGELLPFPWHKSYGRCAKCGGYVNREPIKDLKNLYSSKFYRHVQVGSGYPTNEGRIELYRADGRLERWLELVQRYGQDKQRIIEVGCAPGVLLAALQNSGHHCLGVEPDEATAKWIHERFDIETAHGLFPDVELPACDLFMAFDVLEHSPDPEAFIRRAAQLLEPGGVAIIQCPIDRYKSDPPMGEEAKLAFNEVEHLFIYTDDAMRELGRRAGLEVVTLDEKPWHIRHELCIYRKPIHA